MSDVDRDYGKEAQAAAEKHLDDCYAWLDYEEDDEVGVPPEGLTEAPGLGPFCGCMTCQVRETLHAAWPVIAAAEAAWR